MRVTFKDIAEKAGVSYSTVSRVINDHPAVSPDAAEAVRRVMKELGYEPPPPERRRGPMRGAPRKDLTGTVALLFPDSDERAVRTPLSAALTHGIEDYLYEKRVSLMVTHLREGDRLPVCLEKRQVDGVIIRGGELSPAMENRIRSHPAVWLFEPRRRIEWADQVMPDNDAIGQIAFDYLHQRDATSLVAFNPRREHASFRRRCRAFEHAADDAYGMHPLTESRESAVIDRIQAGGAGIFCPGDETAIEDLCREFLKAGISAGTDVPVIACVNDIARVRALVPDMPNIDIQSEAIGRTAAERLLWRLDTPREPTQRLLIAPRLDVR